VRYAKLNMFSFSGLSYSQVEKELRLAIFRGTVDHGSGEVDAITAREIGKIIAERPEFIPKTIDFIKSRIKDPIPSTSAIAMKLLNRIMILPNVNTMQIQRCVAKRVLDTMLRLATPNMGIHPLVQSVASTLIKHWALTCGTDECLSEFADVARCPASILRYVQCANNMHI
jgi:hypothetical protein